MKMENGKKMFLIVLPTLPSKCITNNCQQLHAQCLLQNLLQFLFIAMIIVAGGWCLTMLNRSTASVTVKLLNASASSSAAGSSLSVTVNGNE